MLRALASGYLIIISRGGRRVGWALPTGHSRLIKVLQVQRVVIDGLCSVYSLAHFLNPEYLLASVSYEGFVRWQWLN